MWNTRMATRMAAAAPARADQCGFTRRPANRVKRTMMGSEATSAESHQWPKGSYTWVQVVFKSEPPAKGAAGDRCVSLCCNTFFGRQSQGGSFCHRGTKRTEWR